MEGAPRHEERTGAEASEHTDGESRPDGPLYRIRFQGHLHSRWSGWFDGFAVSEQDDGSTLLTGTIADQPALHGLIIKIRDLGLPLLSVERIGKDGMPWSG